MVLVQLGEKDVAYFKNLESIDPWTHHSIHPDEVSGALIVGMTAGGKHQVKIVELSTGHRTGSVPPKGAVTFHTHNVAPGDVYHPNLSTDVPSWQDCRTIIVGTLSHGLNDHLIFTPNYTYVISVGPVLLRNLKEQAHLSSNSLMVYATAKTQGRYTALVNKMGVNYGADFISHWIGELRDVGFVIEQRREGESVVFNYTGPLPMSEGVSVPLEPDRTNEAEIAAIALGIALLVALLLYVVWK